VLCALVYLVFIHTHILTGQWTHAIFFIKLDWNSHSLFPISPLTRYSTVLLLHYLTLPWVSQNPHPLYVCLHPPYLSQGMEILTNLPTHPLPFPWSFKLLQNQLQDSQNIRLDLVCMRSLFYSSRTMQKEFARAIFPWFAQICCSLVPHYFFSSLRAMFHLCCPHNLYKTLGSNMHPTLLVGLYSGQKHCQVDHS